MNDLDITKYLKIFLDFCIPRICIGCKCKLEHHENVVCSICIKKLKKTSPELLNSEYDKKFKQENIISDFYSPFIFEKESLIKDIIHQLKYNSNIKTGLFLSELLFNNSNSSILKWNADIIIPVPLHRIKKAERGYNQSYYLSKKLAKLSKLKLNYRSIKRIRFTNTQTSLNIIERKENMCSAFICKNDKKIKDKNIILVDDVITTGSTITECAKVLKQKGAKNIFALSAAIAE